MQSNKSNNSHLFNESRRLPVFALLALAASTFITILTETLPAGLLLRISADLKISEAMTGQLVTAYAIGSLIAAIPLSVATRGWNRRPLLILTIAGFAVINLATAWSSNYWFTLFVRFLAGMSSGLLWSIVGGYAARLVPDDLKGRAIAIAMVGTPLALSLGLPASTFLGEILDWRTVFVVMSVASVLLIVWIRWNMPDLPGQDVRTKLTLGRVFALPGMKAILLTLTVFILAHNILYTYIGPFVVPSGLGGELSRVLLIFGITSLIGIAIVGSNIDRHLRRLMLISVALFIVAALALVLGIENRLIIYSAVAVWGLGYGGSATLFQTATAHTSGSDIDVAQAMTVVAWNLSISGGGIAGGLLLAYGPRALPFAVVPLLLIALVTVWESSSHGFR
ncbi:MFS transporter [Xanthomonas hyacinthi]|uniref:MFS transporter n=1 Tax=Xanthomonas hyacinthi TaxID=56455 RepID=A0A2S7EUR2_9XANT|nr:MFS transporter [Xanthomonas hyacinthi]KLD76918.1 MFS transporter [Xanthomonas hyacinthi DSM 19077]PPU96869.1 MFS transporter [Xanthomonas hyacinthi]QGY76185.1 MFS transporter [Xanthomonas hyacinthi]